MVSAPYQYLLAQGVVVADTSDILSDVQTDYKNAFGQDLDTDASTPQGVLITAEALARTEVVNNNAAIANQINPNIAGGVFLDAIMSFMGVQRTVATPTVVPNVTLTGVAGTVIPQGSQAKTAAGDVFGSVSDVTLDGSGNGSVNFQSLNLGAIPCAADALDEIANGGVLGWETVNNTTAGTIGTITQSDQAARALRNNMLAFQGIGLAEAITSALYNTEGVTSLSFRENYTGSPITIEGVTLVAHSVYACVEGGTDLAVASALLENKGSGAAWNGDTSVTLVEPASSQSYAVQFDRPDPIGILIKVTSPNGNADNIIQSVVDYAAGLVQITDQNGTQQTLPGFVVGADVSPFEIASAIITENPGIYVSKVEVALAPSSSFSTDAIAININQIATTQPSYISVITS